MNGAGVAQGLAQGAGNLAQMYLAARRSNGGKDPLAGFGSSMGGLLGGLFGQGGGQGDALAAPAGYQAPSGAGVVQQAALPAIPGTQQAPAGMTGQQLGLLTGAAPGAPPGAGLLGGGFGQEGWGQGAPSAGLLNDMQAAQLAGMAQPAGMSAENGLAWLRQMQAGGRL